MLPVYAIYLLALASAYPQPSPQETKLSTEATNNTISPFSENMPTAPSATKPPAYPTIEIFGKTVDARQHAKIPLIWQIIFGEQGSERLYTILRRIGFVSRKYHADV